jgi:CTP synthase
MSREQKEKLALFCNVDPNLVLDEKDVAFSIYEVPVDLAAQDADVYILEMLQLHVNRLALDDWKRMLDVLRAHERGEVEIAVVGKYISLRDAYKSVYEALAHGGVANRVRVNVRMVESEQIEAQGASLLLDGVHGVLIPGGFGDRGIEGKIAAVRYARERRLPFFGICLGMQVAVIEYARNVAGLTGANSTEFAPATPHPVIDLMAEQRGVTEKGGTMRLGAYPCRLEEGSRARAAYGAGEVSERHRHRYEFNNAFLEPLARAGLAVAGRCPGRDLVEIVECPGHPWFVGCQFHPEFQSTPLEAHPLFRDFVAAAVAHRDGNAT